MAAELSGISFSIFVVLINLPFLYLGYKAIGKGFTLSTLFSIVWIAIFSNFAHDFTPITTDPFLGSIFGGIILGIGVGLIIRNGGSLDGSEIVAIIWDKKSTFSVGEIVMAMNLIILGAAGFVYSWNSAMYSLIAYFIAYKMIDVTITGLEESKGVMIITDADNSKDIADALNANLNRGVTIMYGEGGYLKQPKHILYSVVTRLEITRLKDTVYEVDPAAFITIQDVHDVFGGRFTKETDQLVFQFNESLSFDHRFYHQDKGQKSMPLGYIRENGYLVKQGAFPQIPYLDIIKEHLLGGKTR